MSQPPPGSSSQTSRRPGLRSRNGRNQVNPPSQPPASQTPVQPPVLQAPIEPVPLQPSTPQPPASVPTATQQNSPSTALEPTRAALITLPTVVVNPAQLAVQAQVQDAQGTTIIINGTAWTYQQVASRITDSSLSLADRVQTIHVLAQGYEATMQPLDMFFANLDDNLQGNHNFWTQFSAARRSKRHSDLKVMANAYKVLSKAAEKGRSYKRRYEVVLPWIQDLFGDEWYRWFYEPYITSTVINIFDEHRLDIEALRIRLGHVAAALEITRRIHGAQAFRLEHWLVAPPAKGYNADPHTVAQDFETGLPSSDQREEQAKALRRRPLNDPQHRSLPDRYYAKVRNPTARVKAKRLNLMVDGHGLFHFDRIPDALSSTLPPEQLAQPQPITRVVDVTGDSAGLGDNQDSNGDPTPGDPDAGNPTPGDPDAGNPTPGDPDADSPTPGDPDADDQDTVFPDADGLDTTDQDLGGSDLSNPDTGFQDPDNGGDNGGDTAQDQGGEQDSDNRLSQQPSPDHNGDGNQLRSIDRVMQDADTNTQDQNILMPDDDTIPSLPHLQHAVQNQTLQKYPAGTKPIKRPLQMYSGIHKSSVRRSRNLAIAGLLDTKVLQTQLSSLSSQVTPSSGQVESTSYSQKSPRPATIPTPNRPTTFPKAESVAMFLPIQPTPIHHDIVRFAQTIAHTLNPAQGVNVEHMEQMITDLADSYSQQEIQVGIREVSQRALETQYNAMLAPVLSSKQQSILAVCMSMFFALSMWEMTSRLDDRWKDQVRQIIDQMRAHLEEHHRQTIRVVFGIDPSGREYAIHGNDFDLKEWLVDEPATGWLYHTQVVSLAKIEIHHADNPHQAGQCVLNGSDIADWLNTEQDESKAPKGALTLTDHITELFIVHHVNGNHYILHVVDLGTGDLLTFDSFNQAHPGAVDITRRFVARIRPRLDLLPASQVQVERQANASDCGFWAVRNASVWAIFRVPAPPESTGSLRLGLLTAIERRFRLLVDLDIAQRGDQGSRSSSVEELTSWPIAASHPPTVTPPPPSTLTHTPVWWDDYIPPRTADLEVGQPIYHRQEQVWRTLDNELNPWEDCSPVTAAKWYTDQHLPVPDRELTEEGTIGQGG